MLGPLELALEGLVVFWHLRKSYILHEMQQVGRKSHVEALRTWVVQRAIVRNIRFVSNRIFSVFYHPFGSDLGDSQEVSTKPRPWLLWPLSVFSFARASKREPHDASRGQRNIIAGNRDRTKGVQPLHLVNHFELLKCVMNFSDHIEFPLETSALLRLRTFFNQT